MSGLNLFNEPFWNNAIPGAKTEWTIPVKNAAELLDFLQRRGVPVELFKQQRLYLDNLDTPGLEWLRDFGGPETPHGKTQWTIPAKNVAELRDHLARRGISIELFKQQRQYLDNLETPGLQWLRDL